MHNEAQQKERMQATECRKRNAHMMMEWKME